MVRPPTASASGDVLADEVVEDEAGEAAAFGVEGGDAAVDVVVGLLAAGEGEVAELEGEGGDEIEEGGLVISRHWVPRFVLSWGVPPRLPARKSFESMVCRVLMSAKYSLQRACVQNIPDKGVMPEFRPVPVAGGSFFYLYIQYSGLEVTNMPSGVVAVDGVKWFWDLTCEFAGVFGGVLAKKNQSDVPHSP